MLTEPQRVRGLRSLALSEPVLGPQNTHFPWLHRKGFRGLGTPSLPPAEWQAVVTTKSLIFRSSAVSLSRGES